MKCAYCQGEMQRGTTPFHIDRKGFHITVDAVPAWVCGQCGEAYFDEGDVDALQQMVAVLEEKAENLKLIA